MDVGRDVPLSPTCATTTGYEWHVWQCFWTLHFIAPPLYFPPSSPLAPNLFGTAGLQWAVLLSLDGQRVIYSRDVPTAKYSCRVLPSSHILPTS